MRRLRRVSRDYLHRGSSALHTIRKYASMHRGELLEASQHHPTREHLSVSLISITYQYHLSHVPRWSGMPPFAAESFSTSTRTRERRRGCTTRVRLSSSAHGSTHFLPRILTHVRLLSYYRLWQACCTRRTSLRQWLSLSYCRSIRQRYMLLAYSLARSLTHSPTHLLTHSLVDLLFTYYRQGACTGSSETCWSS